MPTLYSCLAALWVVVATLRWWDDDSSPVDRWLFTAVAIVGGAQLPCGGGRAGWR
jgi:hypothetical protein